MYESTARTEETKAREASAVSRIIDTHISNATRSIVYHSSTVAPSGCTSLQHVPRRQRREKLARYPWMYESTARTEETKAREASAVSRIIDTHISNATRSIVYHSSTAAPSGCTSLQHVPRRQRREKLARYPV
ncbi:hypothetical protein J6590_010145 [Homalodisca vitripennis]|nr:hypothetical protein J6590_010145 [Homalodisca vitripennis]